MSSQNKRLAVTMTVLGDLHRSGRRLAVAAALISRRKTRPNPEGLWWACPSTASSSRLIGGKVGGMNLTSACRSAAVVIALSALAAGCSPARSVAGYPTPEPSPAFVSIDATMALTDSFDILPDGKCAGRNVFRGVGNGAVVEARGASGFGPFVTTTVTTNYERNNPRRRPGGDDGRYCVVTFRFGPIKPDIEGYWVQFPLGPGRGYGFMTTLTGGLGYGPYDTVIQTCADYDAPPERLC
jgi:hypothetical protein